MTVSLASEASDQRLEVLGVLTAPTAGSTVTIDLNTGANTYKWTAAQTETVNASGKQLPGQEICCIIVDSGGRTITFGTGFKAADTIVGTNGKTATIVFRSDGTNLHETSRTLLLT